MTKLFGVTFLTETPEDAEQFTREYILEAITRLHELDACETISFAPAINPETEDKSAVNLGATGDPEQIISHERDKWDTFVEEEEIKSWEIMEWDEEKMNQMMGEQSSELSPHLTQLSAKMAQLAFDTFDDVGTRPAAVDTFPEEDSETAPTGWWSVLHTLTAQLNYSLDEELDAYTYGIEHTLRNFAEYESEKEAEARVDNLIDEFEHIRDEVSEGRLET